MDSDETFRKKVLFEIKQLKKENSILRETCHDFEKIFKQCFEIIENHDNYIATLKDAVCSNKLRIDSMPFELSDPDYQSCVFKPEIMTIGETRRQIIEERKSIGRFGDGEFGIIEGIGRWNFQIASDKLAEKLLTVLNSEDEGFLVGLNKWFYSNLSMLDSIDADGVRSFMTPERRLFHSKLLKRNRIYGNLNLHQIESDNDVLALKKIWDKKEITIIEGKYTRMGVGNDLLDNCLNVGRILAPAENAIDRYEDIMSEAIKQDKNKTILISLGPTATALAYDLFKEGYQAIDIGHIDLIYEKYLRSLKGLKDLFIPYKYCTSDEQTTSKRLIDNVMDDEYEEQILARLY